MQALSRSVSPPIRSPVTARPLQLLLLQARSKPEMEKQEQSCFVERCRVPRDQFRVVNVGRGDVPALSHLTDVDAVLIGGAGQYSAADDYPWMSAVLDFVRLVVDEGVPLFGSCWGHQIIARALGGRVVYDPEHSELGCGWVELTDAGETDPLFHRFPSRFRANMGHHDRVVDLPSGATELARNQQPYQAFRLEEKPVYCTQFHSELDAERERERILVYKELYRDALPADGTVQEVLESLADTTAVDDLLYDFLTTFVARRNLPPDPVALQPSSAPDSASPLPDDPPTSSRRIPDS